MEKIERLPSPMKVKLARFVTLINLACWPVMALLYYNGLGFVGSLVFWLAVLTLLITVNTGVFRIVGGRVVDDFEKDMQRRANSFAYGLITIFIVILIAYRISHL